MSHVPSPFGAPTSLPIPVVPMPDYSNWTYRRIERSLRTETAPTEQELNALGVEGWELVGMFFDSPLLYVYLKRPA